MVTARSRRTAASEGRLPAAARAVQAVAGEFAGSDVGPDGAGLGARGEQIGDHVLELLPRPGDVFATVQQGYGQFGVVAVRAEATGEERLRRIQDLLTARRRTPEHGAPLAPLTQKPRPVREYSY